MINFVNFSRIILILICIIFSVYSMQYYYGSKYLFIGFNLSILYLTYYLTSFSSSFFSFFLAFYLFMGFWFKYNLSLVFNNGYIFDSGSLRSSNIDSVLLVSIYLFLVLIIANYFAKKLSYYNKFDQVKKSSYLSYLYSKNIKKTLFSFIFLFLIIALINFNLKIYIKGLIFDNNYNLIFINSFKWLILYGLMTFSCFLLNNNFFKEKKISIFVFLIIFFELFVSNLSMLSRSMLLFGLPIIYSYVFYEKKLNFSFLISFIIILVYLSFSLLSALTANEIRANYLKEFQNSLKQETLNDNSQEDTDNLKNSKKFDFQLNEIDKGEISGKRMTTFIIINRWIGIDSLINVSNSDNLGFPLFFSSFKEKKSKISNTFYESNFNLENKKPNFFIKKTFIKGNTLPGIFSFLYYTGSVIFLLLCSFIILVIFSFLEKKIYNISNKNIYYVSFLSHYIVYRLFNFGYAPKDTYLFILSIILSIFLIYFLESNSIGKRLNNLK